MQLTPEAVENRPLDRLNHLMADNPRLQEALAKAQETNEEIAPFTVEFTLDGNVRRKFDCRLEHITLDGGAKVITLSMQAPSERSARKEA